MEIASPSKDQQHSEPDNTPDNKPSTSEKSSTLLLTVSLIVTTLPSYYFWRWEQDRTCDKQRGDNTLIWTYILTGTIGMSLAILLQLIFAYSTAFLLFGSEAQSYITEFTKGEGDIQTADHKAKRRQMSRRWQYWVYMFIFCFGLAGPLEEGIKYGTVMVARRYGRIVYDRDYVTIPVAASLGFSTLENMAFVYGAYKQGEGTGRLSLTLFERVVVGIPGHAMTAALIGVNMIVSALHKQPQTFWHVSRESVLFHGVFDFVLFAVSAYNGNVGWVHPREGFIVYFTIALVIGIQSSLAGLLWQRIQQYGIVLEGCT